MDRNNKTVKQLAKDNVALRKESVDRNKWASPTPTRAKKSLSARRAWIEIIACLALLPNKLGRSPQGERG